MSKQALNTLKNWFKTGLKPTQAQFWDWLDSFWHKDEKIPVEQVEGLSELLNDSVSLTQFNSGLAAKADTTHTHTSSDLTDWLGYVPEDPASKNQPEGYAGLDAAGKISAAQLPAIALNNTFVVDSEEDMLSLVAETGDVAIRSDENKTYILAGEDPGEIEDWQELLATIPPVGNGLTLESDGIGLGGILNKETILTILSNASLAIQNGNRTVVDFKSTELKMDHVANTTTLDWTDCHLKDINGNVAFDWSTDRTMRGSDNQLSVRLQQRQLWASNTIMTLNWSIGVINSSNGVQSIYWNDRILFDEMGNPSVYWNVKRLYSDGIPSILWKERLLFNSGGLAMVDYSSTTAGLRYTSDYSANYTSRSLVDKAYVDKLKPIEIEIGDWDMETEPIKIIPHGLSNWKNVRKISCIVRNDDDTFRLFLNNNTHNNLDNSGIAIDGTNIYITSGNNDYTTYQSTSYNRGYITVEFKS